MKHYIEGMLTLVVYETGFWIALVVGLLLWIGLTLWTGIAIILCTILFYYRLRTNMHDLIVTVNEYVNKMNRRALKNEEL